MATERLTVLAGAAALGEFTAPELAAYTGANANTVRQVLQREQKRNGFFERVEPKIKPANGRPAILWRLNETHRAQILDEIAHEKAKISQLRDSVEDDPNASRSLADPIERAGAFVSSAEEAITRSFESSDDNERQTLAKIAFNLLHAASPRDQEARVSHQATRAEWWERDHNDLRDQFTASLDTVSRVSIESNLKTALRSPSTLQQEELLRRRAHRVAAFAALSARQAQGLPIGYDELVDAADSISAGSRILPVAQTLSWIKKFVSTSIASGNPAPVAVLTKSQEGPETLFPVTRSWSRVPPPVELARRGYSIWVEPWAKTLLAYSLIPGIVVAHDNSPEANETLTQIMRNTEGFRLDRAIIVVGTTTDPQVVARVSASGGFFYPVLAPLDGLLRTVNRAVIQAVSAVPDLGLSYAIASDVHSFESMLQLQNTSVLDILVTLSTVTARPSELELAERTLAVFDEAVKKFNTVESETKGKRPVPDRTVVYADLVRRVADQLSDLGSSSHALSLAEEVLSSYRKVIEHRLLPSLPRRRGALTRQRLAEIAQRHEIERDMAWVYEISSDPPEAIE